MASRKCFFYLCFLKAKISCTLAESEQVWLCFRFALSLPKTLAYDKFS